MHKIMREYAKKLQRHMILKQRCEDRKNRNLRWTSWQGSGHAMKLRLNLIMIRSHWGDLCWGRIGNIFTFVYDHCLLYEGRIRVVVEE